MITLLLPVIGLIILIFEHRHKREYHKIILDFLNETANNESLRSDDKRSLISSFLENNGYYVRHISSVKICGRKKLFYLSWLFMTYGLYGLYYLWLQRPHKVQIEWENGH